MSDIEAAMNRVEMTAEIVSAYVEHNSVPPGELPALIKSVHDSLDVLSGDKKPDSVPEPLQPKVPIKKSVSTDYIVCLEDGRRFKSLKRHLHSEHGLSPDEYRAKWGLGKDYPMVAPAYADARSSLAKTIGLGRKSVPTIDQDAVAVAGAETATADHNHDEDGIAAPVKRPGRRKAKAA